MAKGFSAFSYNKSDTDRVLNYIMNQKEHHKTVSMQDENHTMLKDAGVEFDVRYTFKPPMD